MYMYIYFKIIDCYCVHVHNFIADIYNVHVCVVSLVCTLMASPFCLNVACNSEVTVGSM